MLLFALLAVYWRILEEASVELVLRGCNRRLLCRILRGSHDFGLTGTWNCEDGLGSPL